MAPRKAQEEVQPESPQPRILEVNASVALNGNVQVKKFDIKSGYHFGLTERWDVTGMTEEQASDFEDERMIKLYDQIDPIAQAEFDKLWDQRLETGE